MFRQDLIKRAIEQLGEALARALRLSQSQPSEALECLREAKGALPIVPGMLDDMSPEDLLESLGPESAEALARVLAAEADLLEKQGRPFLAARPRRQSERLRALLRREDSSNATG
jgi:hypothetical protein